METNQRAFGSSQTHFVADRYFVLYCRAEIFLPPYDTTAECRSVLPAFGTFAAVSFARRGGRLNSVSMARTGAHVLSQAEISAVVNERCLPD